MFVCAPCLFTGRFLPSLAAICSERMVRRGDLVCEQGQPTNATLVIVAHGTLCAWRLRTARDEHASPRKTRDAVTSTVASSEAVGELRAGESLGHTTALLPDSLWQYSATAQEDTWTLSISSRDLSDLLRGRTELARAVLRGHFDTFAKRLTQVIEQGGSVKRDFLLAVDVNKSPNIKPTSRAESREGQLWGARRDGAPAPSPLSTQRVSVTVNQAV